MVLAFIVAFTFTLRKQMLDPDYTSTTVVNYFSYYSNADNYTMSTQD